MIKQEKHIDLLAMMYLGNITLVLSLIFIGFNFVSKDWIKVLTVILVFISGLAYYLLLIIFLSHYIEKMGDVIKRFYQTKRRLFVIVSSILFFVIMFPILTFLLGDTKKVIEIYSYVILTGIITYIVTKFAKKDNDKESTP